MIAAHYEPFEPFAWTPALRVTRATVQRATVQRALARRGRGGARERRRVADVLAFVMELSPRERGALGLSTRERGELWRGVVVGADPWLGWWRERAELDRALGWPWRPTFGDDL